MQNTHVPRRCRRKPRARRGAVTVELAFIVPVFVTLLLGMIEASRLYDTHNELSSAIRSGARLACMDREGMLADGQSTNDKITQDIRNILSANGLPGDDVDVIIADADYPEIPFNLDDPANDLELFQVRVEVPYSALNPLWPPESDYVALTSFIVMRNAKAAIVQ